MSSAPISSTGAVSTTIMPVSKCSTTSGYNIVLTIRTRTGSSVLFSTLWGAAPPSRTRHNRTDRERPRTIGRAEGRSSCDNDDEFLVRVMSMERRNLPARGDLVQRRTQASSPSLSADRCHAVEEEGLVAFELPLRLKDICHPVSV
jgi:hypothetical protein